MAGLLSRGKYSEPYIFNYLDRIENHPDAYLSFREDGLGPTELLISIRRLKTVSLTKQGDTFSCLFKFHRDKMDKDLGVQKGDKIPVDFTYRVEASFKGSGKVILSSKGEYRPSFWKGEVHSNVVYLRW